MVRVNSVSKMQTGRFSAAPMHGAISGPIVEVGFDFRRGGCGSDTVCRSLKNQRRMPHASPACGRVTANVVRGQDRVAVDFGDVGSRNATHRRKKWPRLPTLILLIARLRLLIELLSRSALRRAESYTTRINCQSVPEQPPTLPRGRWKSSASRPSHGASQLRVLCLASTGYRPGIGPICKSGRSR